MRRLVGISLVTLTGCLLQNPAYGDHDGATGGASASTGASTGGPATGATTSTSSDGSVGSDSASGTAAPTSGSPGSTTGEVTAGTGSTGQADTGSSTGAPAPVTCPGQEIKFTLTAPARDTFVVTTPDATCQWKNSDGAVLNQSYPCAKQNYGGYGARYTVIGQQGGGHAEYLVAFGLFDALEDMGIDQTSVAVASAKLRIVAWWSADRGPVSFRVGAIADSDAWVEGTKEPDLAGDGDSSWEYRWIEDQNAMHTWTDPAGPAAGSAQVATVEVPALTAAEFSNHPYYESGDIAGSYLQPWITDAAAERGFVITTDDAPILVKSIDTGFEPQLVLILCPLP